MSSMRLYGKLVASENGELAGTHCVVQWEEEGDPRSVVEKKRMIDFSGIGETCKVRVTEKAKTVVYPASWLRVVSHSILIYRYRIPLFYTTGSKSEMEKILNTFEGDDDVPVGSKAKKSVSRRPKQTSANQKSKGAVKAFQKKKAQEEADRVTKLLLAGLQDVTEAAPTATTNLHLSPSPGSKQSDHQKSPLPNQGENSLTHSPSTTLSPVIHLDGALNSPPPTRKDGSLSPDLFSSDTPLIQRADLPPMKRKRTETTEIIHSKRALLQETSTFSELDSENYNSYVALSPSTPRLSEHSTPDTGRLQPTPLQLSSLQEWMKRQFEQLNCKIDKNAKTIEELKTIIAKKKTKKLVSNGVSNGNDVECVIREEVPPLQDPLMVCCGQPRLAGKHVYLKLPTEAAVAEFRQLEGCPPKEPGKFALKLLSIFFCDEELSESNCTKAEGRKLLDQNILLGIKYHTNFKFPVSPGEETKRWQSIVTKNLNTKCRAARRKLRLNEDQKKVPSLVQVEGNEEQS